jgi:hypothetical protein
VDSVSFKDDAVAIVALFVFVEVNLETAVKSIRIPI